MTRDEVVMTRKIIDIRKSKAGCWEWAVAVIMARRIEAKVFARMISA
jgi:hypothetical protein